LGGSFLLPFALRRMKMRSFPVHTTTDHNNIMNKLGGTQ
jgi:hypothetical protein